MHDVVALDERRERVEDDLVHRGCSRRASHDEDGRHGRIEREEFMPALFRGSLYFLADRVSRARYLFQVRFWELRGGVGVREGDPAREARRPQRHAAGFRVGVVDDDGKSEEARGVKRGERGVAAR